MSTQIEETHTIYDGDYFTDETFTTYVDTWDEFLFVDEAGYEHEGEVRTHDKSSITFTIYKGQDIEKGRVSGWANVAKNADGSIPLDWQGDVIDPLVLEDAAVEFMKNYRESGECHQGDAIGEVVESIVLTKDKQEAMGIPENTVPEGWFITVQLYDEEVIEKVKDGTYKMFSIQGTGERVAI